MWAATEYFVTGDLPCADVAQFRLRLAGFVFRSKILIAYIPKSITSITKFIGGVQKMTGSTEYRKINIYLKFLTVEPYPYFFGDGVYPSKVA